MARPTALITGASAGIGVELARQFAAHGYDLVLTARRQQPLQTLADELEGHHSMQCRVILTDLSEPDGPAGLVDELNNAGITVDLLVNNAGFGVYGPFLDAEPQRLQQMLYVNIFALTQLTRLLLPGMLERGQGKILNVASIAAFQPGPLLATYSATKAYVLSLSEALSEELRGTGVTVTCLCPGPTRTEFAEVAGMAVSRLFQGPNVMDVLPVAKAGCRATLRGQRRVVPGFSNKLAIFGSWITPRWLLLKIIKRIQGQRKQ